MSTTASSTRSAAALTTTAPSAASRLSARRRPTSSPKPAPSSKAPSAPASRRRPSTSCSTALPAVLLLRQSRICSRRRASAGISASSRASWFIQFQLRLHLLPQRHPQYDFDHRDRSQRYGFHLYQYRARDDPRRRDLRNRPAPRAQIPRPTTPTPMRRTISRSRELLRRPKHKASVGATWLATDALSLALTATPMSGLGSTSPRRHRDRPQGPVVLYAGESRRVCTISAMASRLLRADRQYARPALPGPARLPTPGFRGLCRDQGRLRRADVARRRGAAMIRRRVKRLLEGGA